MAFHCLYLPGLPTVPAAFYNQRVSPILTASGFSNHSAGWPAQPPTQAVSSLPTGNGWQLLAAKSASSGTQASLPCPSSSSPAVSACSPFASAASSNVGGALGAVRRSLSSGGLLSFNSPSTTAAAAAAAAAMGDAGAGEPSQDTIETPLEHELFERAKAAQQVCATEGKDACEDQVTDLTTKVLELANPEDAGAWKAVEIVVAEAQKLDLRDFCAENPDAPDCKLA